MAATGLEGWDTADAQALALELRSARRVSAALRKAVAALTVMLLAAAARAAGPDGQIPPAERARIRADLDTAIAALAVPVGAQTAAAVTAGIALAIRQEASVLARFGVDATAVRVSLTDPVLTTADQTAQRVLAAAIGDVQRFAASSPLASTSDLQAVAAKARSTVGRVEANTRFLTNRAINQATVKVAASATTLQPPPTGEPPISVNGRTPLVDNGLRVVWVNERDACLVCLALAGHVIDPNSGEGFDEEATFSTHPAPPVWPPGMPLMGPPRHPNCRCRLRIISAANTMVPAALQREAQRSVARGWSASDSRKARLSAADHLVRRANRLPRTVNERAAENVAAGRFSTRHRPRAPHLRDD